MAPDPVTVVSTAESGKSKEPYKDPNNHEGPAGLPDTYCMWDYDYGW